MPQGVARDVDLDERFYNGDAERLFCAAMYALLPGEVDAARKAARAPRRQSAPAISCIRRSAARRRFSFAANRIRHPRPSGRAALAQLVERRIRNA